ncbi:NAD(P)-dependent oxidoreductase [Hydrogenophaga sp. 2FB]|uniref:NAD(P)-dependent oxidoreductase n=1 Tax=Hydrogenophaga sp. 2FB TaxID=2502187 RepID=UPI0010F816E3|nr:NAD(P)-dependent oxidoreductase [Hydrogenophaga sp. 2FB]
MSPHRVVFLDAATLPFPLSFDASLGIRYEAFESTSAQALAGRIDGAEIVITNKVRLDAAQLRRASALKLICVAAAGTDNIDLTTAAALGIGVHNVPDYGSESVAEHVIASLFALRRELRAYASAASDGRWGRSPHFCWLGPSIHDLAGSVLGIVGRGRIGQATARKARALGMQVLFAQTPGKPCADDEREIDSLLADVDAVSLHIPLTPATRGLIDARRLGLMKPQAVLINTGRGALVDPFALAQALRTGVIAAAAIDVLEQEPPRAGHPLLAPHLKNLLLTPHVAWASQGAQQRLATRLVELVTGHVKAAQTAPTATAT